MIGKNYCIGYVYTHASQIDCFRRVHKFLRWIWCSDLKVDFIPGDFYNLHQCMKFQVLYVITIKLLKKAK